MEEKIGKE